MSIAYHKLAARKIHETGERHERLEVLEVQAQQASAFQFEH